MGKHARASGSPDAERPAGRRAKPRTSAGTRASSWRELPLLVVLALLVALLVKTFVLQAFFIPSGSMEQTLHGCPGCRGDRVLVNKLSYRVGDIQRGQIVVFRGTHAWPQEVVAATGGNVVTRTLRTLAGDLGLAPSNETDFIKRVIALAGDTVQCCDAKGRIQVNGRSVDEPYLYEDNQRAFGPRTVPKGYVWVMGDHRSDSSDARDYGPIPKDHVVGRAFVLVYPISRWRWLGTPHDFEKAGVGSP